MIKMKRILIFLCVMLAIGPVLYSCSEKEEHDNRQFSVSPSSLVFGMDGGTQSVSLRTSAGSWTLSASDGMTWCRPDRTSGISSTTITFTADKNTGEERTAVFTFSAGENLSLEFVVSQSGDEEMAAFDGETVVPDPEEWDGSKLASISYQALVYSFADGNADGKGDLAGLQSRLDYLDALGVSGIWLSPIHPSTSYHGYDVTDYSAVNPDFGTEADFQSFVNAAHSKGIEVYMDYVLNHSSSEHPWFREAVASESSDYRNFYAFSKDPKSDITAGNIAQIADEGASGYDSGQWFPTGAGTGAEGRFKFVLDWNGTSPTVTVSKTTDPADEDNISTAPGGKYLYFGEEICKRFHKTSESNIYELTLDFASDWGFLIRTSTTSWASGTKYGARDNSSIIEFGKPFSLVSNASSDPSDIRFSQPVFYHSHFWTSSFADFNYGPASECEQSGAFKALSEAADKWIGMKVDGFRLDAVKHIYHNALSDENPVFLKKFYDRMNGSYKSAGGECDFYMVGEMLSDASEAAPYYAGLPALFDFSFWYRLKWALQSGTGCYFVKDILSYRELYKSYRQDYIEATKLSNHDEDRTGSELGRDLAKMKLAAAILLTAPGNPYIYQGEELGYWGTKSGGDEYVRTPMLWDKAGTDMADGNLGGKIDRDMLTSSISVEAQQEDASSILNVYRDFARLRNTYQALASGDMVRHDVYNETNTAVSSVAAWYMVSGEDRMLVVHNLGDKSVRLEFADNLDTPVGLLGTAKVKTGETSSDLMLGACSSVVFDLK